MTKEKSKNSKVIASALAGLEKRFDEKVVMKMSDSGGDAKTFSSGRPDLDAKLGGGYAVGKLVEIYAESGCGKTGMALEAIKSIQDLGGIAAIIDAEHALNKEYCEQIGINIDDLYICQPTSGEQAYEVMRALIGTEEIDLIVVDSVASLTPQSELDGEIGDAKMAVLARMMSKGIKMITAPASRAECTIIFINQLRQTMAMYGPSETTTGGKALKFYATQRLEIKNRGRIKQGEETIGFKQHIQIVKNKIAAPFQTLDNDIIYGKGVDKLTGIIDACIELGVLERKGAWYAYNGVNLAQGMTKLRVMLEDNPELVQELTEQL